MLLWKNLLKHDVPEVKKWVKQLIPLLKKSEALLNKIQIFLHWGFNILMT